VRQKYFFDPTFGDAFSRLRRNQFYPINTFSGFSYGGIERRFSPINVNARLRPVSALFADVRFDYDVQRNGVKDVALTAGARGRTWSVNETWYFNRRFRALRGRVEPGTFSGNQWITSFSLGDTRRGLYGGSRLNIDFTNRIDESDPEDGISGGQLLNTRTYLGYSWDCCGVQLNYATFNLPSGLRRESQLYFTFSLAGLGSIGNGNIGQPAQTRRISRPRPGRDTQLDLPEDESGGQ
jgi:LPS-assembly protein